MILSWDPRLLLIVLVNAVMVMSPLKLDLYLTLAQGCVCGCDIILAVQTLATLADASSIYQASRLYGQHCWMQLVLCPCTSLHKLLSRSCHNLLHQLEF